MVAASAGCGCLQCRTQRPVVPPWGEATVVTLRCRTRVHRALCRRSGCTEVEGREKMGADGEPEGKGTCCAGFERQGIRTRDCSSRARLGVGRAGSQAGFGASLTGGPPGRGSAPTAPPSLTSHARVHTVGAHQRLSEVLTGRNHSRTRAKYPHRFPASRTAFIPFLYRGNSPFLAFESVSVNIKAESQLWSDPGTCPGAGERRLGPRCPLCQRGGGLGDPLWHTLLLCGLVSGYLHWWPAV